MRIAYLTQSYPPMISGASIVARQLAEGMARRGHQVLVIAASDKKNPYITLEPNLTVMRLASVHNPWRVGQRFLLFSRAALTRALRDFQPDVIHAHDPLQLGLTGAAYARRSNIPALLTIHQLPWFAAPYLPDIGNLRAVAESVLWTYAGRLLRKFDVTNAPTRTTADIVTDRIGIQPRVISCGLDLRVFSPSPLSTDLEGTLRKKFGLPARVPVILHVGRLDADKSVDQVIRAAAQAIPESDAHLLVVGDGVQKPALMELCRSLGISERVHFAGYVTLKDGLADVYRLGSVFVTASEIETQGIVLLEAAASGLPTVAVRATCVHEIVHHEQNGFLAESGDIVQLGQQLKALIMSPSRARQMGQMGRRLSEAHSAQKSFDAFEENYREVMLNIKTYRARGNQYLSIKRFTEWISSICFPEILPPQS